MAYTNAVFYLDVVNGSDAARTTLTGVVFSNPSSTTVLGTYVSHGLVTGAVIDVTGCTQAYANSAWKITWVSADTFTLDDALWASFNGADVTGNAVPRGGMNFTDAWKSFTDGATAARIAPGDEIRIAKSPTPVSTEISGTFTNPPSVVQAAKTINSSTNATPIVVTLNSHGYATGDIVTIYNHATNLTANGTWSITKVDDNKFSLDNSVGVGAGSSGSCVLCHNRVIKMASALPVKTVTRCETAWTPSGSSSVSVGTSNYKEGDASFQFSKSSPSNSTLYAYLPVSGNFSDYNCLSCWIRVSTAIAATSTWSLWLCTNADGTGGVDEFRIPVLPQVNENVPITITKEGGGTLSASVASIALYSGTSAATTAGIMLDNIIATKTGNINLQSLVSKGISSEVESGTESWYPIKSISEDCTIISIDFYTSATAVDGLTSHGYGYYGAGGAGTVYYRQPSLGPISTTAKNWWTVNKSGSEGSLIKYYGGYNTSTMERDGDTWIDGSGSAAGYLGSIQLSSKSYIEIDHINIVRLYAGITITSSTNITVKNFSALAASVGISTIGDTQNSVFEKIWNLNNNAAGATISGPGLEITECVNCNNCTSGVNVSGVGNDINITNTCNSATQNLNISGSNNIIKIANASYGMYGIACSGPNNSFIVSNSVSYNTSYGFQLNGAENTWVYGGASSNNSLSGVYAYGNRNCFHNTSFSDSTPYTQPNVGNSTIANKDWYVSFENYGGTPGDHRLYFEGGTIVRQAVVYHSPSTGAWKLSPTNAVRLAYYPLSLVIGRIYCTADKLVTVKAWMCRDNTGLTMSLICSPYQLAGITPSASLSASMTAAAGTWDSDQENGEELTITFTPTESGVVEIKAQAYGGTTYNGYVSDMEITQAD